MQLAQPPLDGADTPIDLGKWMRLRAGGCYEPMTSMLWAAHGVVVAHIEAMEAAGELKWWVQEGGDVLWRSGGVDMRG